MLAGELLFVFIPLLLSFLQYFDTVGWASGRASSGNRTLRTQDTLVPRHFGTGAKVSGQFGPKILRHQDISALMRGHFSTTAERR